MSGVAEALRVGPFDQLNGETRDAIASAVSVDRVAVGDVVTLGPETGLVIVLDGACEIVDITPGSPVATIRALTAGSAYDPRQLTAFGEDLTVHATSPMTYATVAAVGLDAIATHNADLRVSLDRLRRRTLLCRLHRLVGPLDEGFIDRLEEMAFWQSLPRGAELAIRPDLPDLFLVVSGRVRVLQDTPDGPPKMISEAALGESVTEGAFFGVEPPSGRIVAIRDSVLVGFSPGEFDRVVQARPEILRRVTRTLLQRLQRPSRRASVAPITNVAVVPFVAPDQGREFVDRLEQALLAHGRVLRLEANDVDRRLGISGIAHAEEGAEAEHLGAWLDAREHDHRFVVYVASPSADAWTRRCLRQADRILLVADFDADPVPDAAEREILAYTHRLAGAFETLVLLHRDGSQLPRDTRRWLDERPVENHVHVRWDRDDDVQRLARMLAGRTIGLALGGGGARGFAHIGTLRALAEAGIPIDHVAGTSMGANIAAQHAMGWSPDRMATVNRRIWIELAPQKKYTLPLVSVLAGRRSEACARIMYGDFDIEDLWIPFFCMSSDLTAADSVVHEHGSLREAATASASLPGIAVPVLHDGHLLVDGGLLDNLPVSILREIGCGLVIAAEVTAEEDAIFAVDRVPSPWEVLRGRVQHKRAVMFPSMGDLVMRAAMLHSTNRTREALATADLTLRPPVNDYRLMDFKALDELDRIGTTHARDRIRQWLADPTLATRLSRALEPVT